VSDSVSRNPQEGDFDRGGVSMVSGAVWKIGHSGDQKTLDCFDNSCSCRCACVAALPTAHCPIKVRNQHHFAYPDGMPYLPLPRRAMPGCTRAIHFSARRPRLYAQPPNKIRMCVFPSFPKVISTTTTNLSRCAGMYATQSVFQSPIPELLASDSFAGSPVRQARRRRSLTFFLYGRP
jgi:hypothetical protein